MPAKVDGKVRVGIIGCGGITRQHARGYLACPDKIEVVALCDVSETTRKDRAEQLGASPREFSDWKEMIREMGDGMNAVDIALPHHLHTPAILDAIEAGKHILCEKPMCINLEEADKIVNAVNDAGITYMSAHNQLFMGAVQEAKRRIEAGEIGDVYWIRSMDCFLAGGGKGSPFEGKWRAKLEYQGGGELIDTGYHPTYRLLYLSGSQVVGVRGNMGRYYHPIEGEDAASVLVKLASGAMGEILTSWAFPVPYGSYQIHLIGSKGQLFGSFNNIFILREGEKEPEKIDVPETDMHILQIEHFADCLLEGKRPIHSAEEGREVLQVILGASQDAEGWQQYAQLKV